MPAPARAGAGEPFSPDDPMRLMLHVAEAGLRSTLVARLTLGGADVATVRELTHDRPRAAARAPMALVIDEAGAHAYPGGIAGLYGDARWARLVLLTSASRPDDAPPHLHHLDGAGAAASLAALLDAWRPVR